MIKSEKRFNELAEILKKGNNLFITDAIKSLREKEPFEGAVGLLVAFYNENSGISGLRIVEDFLNDIKDPSVRPEVMTEIQKPWKTDTLGMLVSSCWQSGLDYSEYIADMAKIFLEADYATAVECMSVIEESVKNSSRKRREEIIRIVEKSPLSYINEKNTLTQELISILER